MKKLFAALGICFLLLLTSTSAHAERRIYSYTSYNTWNGEPLDIYVGANENSGFVTGALEGAISCTVGVYEGDSYAGAPRFGRSPDGVWYAYDAELNRFMPLAYFNSELLNNVLRTVLSDEFQQAVREEIAEAETRQAEAQRQEELRKLREQERKNKEAEAFYNQAQAADPYIKQGMDYYANKKWKEGDEAFERAIQLAPSYDLAYEAYVDRYIKKGKWEKVEDILTRAIKNGFGKNIKYRYYRGYAIYQNCDGFQFPFWESIKYCEKLLKKAKICADDFSYVIQAGDSMKYHEKHPRAQNLFTDTNAAIYRLNEKIQREKYGRR